jgi:hypothetical protein
MARKGESSIFYRSDGVLSERYAVRVPGFGRQDTTTKATDAPANCAIT